jgi:putative hydrolase of the HAD superfamily
MISGLRAVIFDFGAVLGLPQDPEREAAMVSLSRAPSVEAFRALYEPGRLAMDRGTLSMEDYWSELLRACGVTPTAELIQRINQEDLWGWTRANAKMVNWSRELRTAGFRTAILSNMSPARLSFMRASGDFGWLEEFEVAVYSYELGMVKPDPGIYRACLDRLGLPAEACLLVDDLAANVEAARAMGIKAHLFNSAEEATGELDGLWNLPVSSLAGAAMSPGSDRWWTR